MIKFFRKIRYNLMETPPERADSVRTGGKTGKYFKYAIGEIVLVVIGILIALQINNWNETRKDNNSKLKIIEYLILDLKKDIHHFKDDGIRNQKSIDFIHDFLQSGEIENSTDFINIIDERYSHYPNNSKYKSIISTNQIDLLDEVTLSKLTTYYEYDYVRLNARVKDSDNITIKIEEFIVTALPKHPSTNNDENFNAEVSTILARDEIYNLFLMSSHYREDLNELMKSTQKKAERLVIELKKIMKS